VSPPTSASRASRARASCCKRFSTTLSRCAQYSLHSLSLRQQLPNPLSHTRKRASSCQRLSHTHSHALSLMRALEPAVTVRQEHVRADAKGMRGHAAAACTALLRVLHAKVGGVAHGHTLPTGKRESQTTSSAMCNQCEKPSSRRPGSALPRGHSRHLSPHKAQGKRTNADDHETHARNTGRQARGANAAPGRVSGHTCSRVSEE